MSGLRERQKEQRRQVIAEAALELFKRNGFAATTLDQIAVQAGVSAPTVVNYFGGKQEILLALLKQPDEQAMREARANLDEDSDPLEALCEFEGLMTDYQLQAMPASLWRELAPFLLTGELAEAMSPWNAAVIEETKALLLHFQQAGKVRESIDIDVVATLFNQYANMAFIRLATQENPDRTAHALHMRGVLNLLCHGMLAR
ncbi:MULTISPECIES: TetR/AcrR family transcriptional regulator [Pseudomonas]|uniref:TetR family transcriptional regulator n=3 Tax=Pseudomonas TaxID=286 RepID=A0A0A6FLF3_9PSED|nr:MULTISPECIES: TetR/AcrR family transcriptional regulator [Pseudomonas]KHA73576.1 TetR family transcriptional regulator [Pseudomonas chlororaphis]MDD1001393.1 TetR/AcrR family transcriptional regulator [Pseudomonas sp. TNT2022 ID642]TDV49657.1 TetR family transcriptional regulator [Pseudomonas helmanticensis]VVP86821.1 HTH-type transcriptional regulator BetI [Pseudomonas fluorescens]